MTANGRVITGYSMPKYAVIGENGYGTVKALARGVSVSMDIETADDNNFYADNVLAESASGLFTGGTLTLTVDGLKDDARKDIQGLPTADSVTITEGGTATVSVYVYDDRQTVPYCGIGFVVRYMEEGVTSYVPVVLTKVQFSVDSIEANTQEEDIDWQTSELSAKIFRDDTTNHSWRKIGAAQTTEAKATAVISALLANS